MGVLAEVVDGDVLQPLRQVHGHAALRGRDGKAAVAVGDLLGELGQGLLPGVAVDGALTRSSTVAVMQMWGVVDQFLVGGEVDALFQERGDGEMP